MTLNYGLSTMDMTTPWRFKQPKPVHCDNGQLHDAFFQRKTQWLVK